MIQSRVHNLWRSDLWLDRHNTLALSAKSRWYNRACSVQELSADIKLAKNYGIPLRILGQGSNVVLKDFDGLTLTPSLPGIWITGDRQRATVRVGAGVDWPTLVDWCCANGLHGLENMAMIPGSVGAAPVQNIGAYGLEISDRLLAIDLFDTKQHKIIQLPASACHLGYRTSRFKQDEDAGVICAVYLRLGSDLPPVLDYDGVADERAVRGGGYKGLYEAICALRSRKLSSSAESRTAGCFFHNLNLTRPAFEKLKTKLSSVIGFSESDDGTVRVPAAQLVEACGWKGRVYGKVGVSERHALVLVNFGGASADDICQLAEAIRLDVFSTFNIYLEQEPILI